MRHILFITLALSVLSFSAFAEETQMYGYNPKLPEPSNALVPTVNTAKAVGWSKPDKPVAAVGLNVNKFAGHLDHPRWIYVLPNNDVLVAETNKPAKENKDGIKGWVMGKVQEHAGAATESANRITLLRDSNNDGAADSRSVFLQNLNSPFGMALIGDDFYVANADAVVKFKYVEGATSIKGAGVKIADLPAGINHHWTKNIIASKDGKKLYASVGSNSNVAEKGMEIEKNRAAILEIDLETGNVRPYGTGLRNPVGMGWNPVTGELWTAVNERDELGNELVPDYMTSVKDGGFYGWPYSYYGQHVDERVEPQNPELVAKAIIPDYALGAHTASLGLAFYEHDWLGPHYKNGVFIGQHGSWNRSPRSGYKLVFIPFENGKPVNRPPEDILTGFVSDKDEAYGRPVGVAVDKNGAVLLADDVGNVIWRVSPVAVPSAGATP